MANPLRILAVGGFSAALVGLYIAIAGMTSKPYGDLLAGGFGIYLSIIGLRIGIRAAVAAAHHGSKVTRSDPAWAVALGVVAIGGITVVITGIGVGTICNRYSCAGAWDLVFFGGILMVIGVGGIIGMYIPSEAPQTTEPSPSAACPMCGSPMTWISLHGCWYCWQCNAYR